LNFVCHDFYIEVPIIVISSALAGDESERIAADLGIEACFTSPMDTSAFIERIRAILEGDQQQIDLLFSDMVPPEGLTGLDLAETFQDSKPDLKVIISSGYSTETVGEAKLSIGNIAYLQKPYKIEVMAKTIRNFFGQK
jgi:DNA-binding NtrC family response regulator